MRLNNFQKHLLTARHWIARTLFCFLAIALVWQGTFLGNSAAMAAPNVNLIAARDIGDKVQDKTSEDAGRAKSFIEDTKDKVKRTASKNAAKVDRADDEGSFVERKAKRDAGRIYERAEEDAARTEKAVDKTKNAVERTVDSIKDAFN
jgi:hypothetical protein